ncbi:MAG: hypothetical protein R3F14_15280, partial [Polyangiaceae bacterium]
MLDRIVIVGAGRTAESLIARLRIMAPTCVLDSSPEALQQIDVPQPSGPEASATDVFPVTKRLADGTSRFV